MCTFLRVCVPIVIHQHGSLWLSKEIWKSFVCKTAICALHKTPFALSAFYFFLIFLRSSSFSFKKLKEKIHNNKERRRTNNATTYTKLWYLVLWNDAGPKRPIAYAYGVLSHLVFRFCGKRKKESRLFQSQPNEARSTDRGTSFAIFLACSVLSIPTPTSQCI